MWMAIDIWGYEDTQLDYIQFFYLTAKDDLQEIHHFQEQPPREEKILSLVAAPVIEKVYVIDDGQYATMLLASEY